jgi:bile-acid 7alpha-dehydratase
MTTPDLESLAREIQRLSDIEAIKRLRSAYFRCLDTANIQELAGLLTEDFACRCAGGDYVYAADNREEFLEMISNSFHSEMVTQHNGHGPEIDVHSEIEATGVVYFHDQVYHFRTKEFLMGTGIYRDRYRKVDDEWKIEYGEYERVYEVTEILPRVPHFTAHYLAQHGKKLPSSAAYDPSTGEYC